MSLAAGVRGASAAVNDVVKGLAARWFVVQNTHAAAAPILMHPRYAMSLLRGPMTRTEIRAAIEQRSRPAGTSQTSAQTKDVNTAGP